MEGKKSLFDGALGQYVLPGIILQSVLIGGGYATGREIMEYGAKFGALGWYSGFAIFLGFTIVSMLSFELVRLYGLYDFKSFIKAIAGPLYRVFDLAYVLLMIVIIAVMSSATGAVVEQMTGLNYWYGVVGITVVVGILNFYGEELISYFETFGTVALYIGYICFSILVITANSDNISRVVAEQDFSYTPDATIGLALWTGILYVAYNLCAIPMGFFTIRRQTSRKQAFTSGIIAGLLMTIPWFLTYYSILGYYPAKDIIEAPAPWVNMMQQSGAPGWMLVFFSFVMGWTLIETATGVIHTLLLRVNRGRLDAGKEELSRRSKGILTVAILVISIVFSKIGVVALIAQAYTALAYAFILLFGLPVLTVGVYKIVKSKEEKKEENAA